MTSEPTGDENGNDKPKPTYTKTPMFEASNAARYQRQALVREIEEIIKPRKLLCFVGGSKAEINNGDVPGFVDLLHNIPQGTSIDLLLHTIGGDLDAAEKLIRLVLAKVTDDAELRIVIPDFAKSAGTLMALGAHRLIMGDSSELGTIDPQVTLSDVQGNHICQSILSYLASFDDYARILRANPQDPVAAIMVQKFDPNVISKFRLVIQRARNSAEHLLKLRGLPFSQIANDLMDLSRWPSHRQMINWEDVRAIGLTVDYLPPSDELWQKYWLLHCYQRISLQEKGRLFESAFVSLPLG
jgi:hypothetical protein